MATREEFQATLADRTAQGKKLGALSKSFQAEFEADILALWKKAFPRRRKFSLGRAEKDLGDVYTAEYERYDARAKEAYDEWKAERDRLDGVLDDLAFDLNPQEGKEWTLYKRVSSATFQSQGFGAIRYAEGAAKMHADDARNYDLPVKIEQKDHKPVKSFGGGSTAHADFMVFVKAEALDLELLKRTPALSLREQVRLCWKRGVNPRVFNPFLPHGFEDQQGLDYFGNDLSNT